MATALEPLGRSPGGRSQNPLNAIRQMTVTQQVVLASAFVAVVLLVLVAGRLASRPTMGILYSDLEPSAAAEVADQLQSRGIEFDLTDGGRVVWVPQDLVASTRLELSGAGLPEQSGGWSVLDNQGITASEFDQRVGYQRAMEGELGLDHRRDRRRQLGQRAPGHPRTGPVRGRRDHCVGIGAGPHGR